MEAEEFGNRLGALNAFAELHGQLGVTVLEVLDFGRGNDGADHVGQRAFDPERRLLAFFVGELNPLTHAVLEAVNGIVLQILNIGPTAVLRTAGKAIKLSLETSPDGVVLATDHL